MILIVDIQIMLKNFIKNLLDSEFESCMQTFSHQDHSVFLSRHVYPKI